MFEYLDLSPGLATPITTPWLDTRPHAVRDVEGLLTTLRQDMFAMNFPGNYLIDVGWYYEDENKWFDFRDAVAHDPSLLTEEKILQHGHFQICIIKDHAWWVKDEDNHWSTGDARHDICKTFEELEALVLEAVKYIREKTSNTEQ